MTLRKTRKSFRELADSDASPEEVMENTLKGMKDAISAKPKGRPKSVGV